MTTRFAAATLFVAHCTVSAIGAPITTFTGQDAESKWKKAVGLFDYEGFESYSINDAVTAFPVLGLIVEPLNNGDQPGIYRHFDNNTPSGQLQIGNAPGNCCIRSQYRYGDLRLRVEAGQQIRGFGFWNGDPDGPGLLRVYDRSGVLRGSVEAERNVGAAPYFSNSFAGIIAQFDIGFLEFDGRTGDGYNHYDDFFVARTPEPGSIILLAAGFAAIVALKSRLR